MHQDPPQHIFSLVVLGVQAVVLAVVLIALLRQHRYRFSIGTLLLWGVPLVAVVAWICSWQGPFFTAQRVVTHKMGALILLADFCAVVVFVHWMRARGKQRAGGDLAIHPAQDTTRAGREDARVN